MKLLINANQVKYDTGKAFLITIPRTKGWKFWIPAKLVYSNRGGYSKSVYIPGDMEIHCVDGKGKKFEINAEQLASYFDHVSIGQKQDPIYHHVPERVEAKETTADEELMR